MPDERSLLERLARPKFGASPTMTENTAERSRSILKNLQRILNTRLGNVPAQMDMGMPSPPDIVQASPDAVGLILKNLRACIEKYEPRLASVEITHVKSEHDVLTLRYQVIARIAGKNGRTLSFETVVDPRGHFRLHG